MAVIGLVRDNAKTTDIVITGNLKSLLKTAEILLLLKNWMLFSLFFLIFFGRVKWVVAFDRPSKVQEILLQIECVTSLLEFLGGVVCVSNQRFSLQLQD